MQQADGGGNPNAFFETDPNALVNGTCKKEEGDDAADHNQSGTIQLNPGGMRCCCRDCCRIPVYGYNRDGKRRTQNVDIHHSISNLSGHLFAWLPS
jgi:hypothetical protein